MLYGLDVLVCYGALWLLLSHLLRRRLSSPSKSFWTLFLLGLLLMGLARLVALLGGGADLGLAPEEAIGFDHETGVPSS